MSNTTRPRKTTPPARARRDDDVFDLDALVNEATAAPFRFRLGGEEFTMASPEELPWRMALDAASGALEPNVAAIEYLLGDDYERFAKQNLPSRKLWALLDACTRHYGMSLGESPAS